MRNRQGGQAMLELILVIPLVLLMILSVLQLAEIIAASLATEWASRHASRAAGVHVEQAEDVARKVAIRILGPFLPPVPGLEKEIRMDDSPVVEAAQEAIHTARARMDDAGKALDVLHDTLESAAGGLDTSPLQQFQNITERAGSTAENVINQNLEMISTPESLTAWSRRLEPKWRWMLRAQFYERMTVEKAPQSDSSFDPMLDGAGIDLRPVVLETVVRGPGRRDGRSRPLTGKEIRRGLDTHKGVGEVQVTVRFRFPLRIPLANRIFADTKRSPLYRTIERTSHYPVMYAPSTSSK